MKFHAMDAVSVKKFVKKIGSLVTACARYDLEPTQLLESSPAENIQNTTIDESSDSFLGAPVATKRMNTRSLDENDF